MNMNGLLNGAKPQVPNGTAQNPNQKSQVALPRCNDVNVIGKTGEGNKPYICKGKYLPKTNPLTTNSKTDLKPKNLPKPKLIRIQKHQVQKNAKNPKPVPNSKLDPNSKTD